MKVQREKLRKQQEKLRAMTQSDNEHIITPIVNDIDRIVNAIDQMLADHTELFHAIKKLNEHKAEIKRCKRAIRRSGRFV
jgi:hypothetical protein